MARVMHTRTAHPHVRPGRLAALLIVVAFGATAGPVSAQQSPAAAEPAATEAPPKPKVELIPIAEIGVQAEREKRLLSDIGNGLEPDAAVVAVAEQLPGLSERVQQQVAVADERLVSEPAITTIDELKRDWDAIAGELTPLQGRLSTRADRLEEQIDGLRKRLERWKVTRAAAVESEAPKAIVSQIDEVLAAGTRVDTSAKSRQGSVVELQSRVAALSEMTRAQLERLIEVRQSLVGLILERDQLPIWSPRTVEGLSPSEILDRVTQTQTKELSITRDWAGRRQESLIFHGLFFLALCVMMFSIRARVRSRAEQDAGLAQVMKVFEHPIALALLLTLLLSVWTFPNMPRQPGQLLGAALLIPAVIVLRTLLDPRLFPILNAIVVFWFVDRVRELLGPLPVAPRVLFLLEMTALVGLMLWWMRPARLGDIPRDHVGTPVFRVVRIGTRVMLALAAIALAAESAGYGALARMLGGAALLAAYAGVILYGAVRVVDGLVAFLLRVRPLRLLGMVRRHRPTLRRRIVGFLAFAAAVWWVSLALDRFELQQGTWHLIVAILSADLELGSFAISLGKVLAAGLTLYVTVKLSQFVRFVLEEDVYPRANLRKGMPYAISSMTHYVLLSAGAFMAVGALGLDLSNLAIIVGALGVGIGFGLQNVVNNFVSGLILLTERPVDVGDSVSLGEVFGVVQRIGIRSSTVRTWQGAEVIVPNANLVSEYLTNWTHSDRRRRLEIEVGVPYGSDPEQILALLLEAAKSNTEIMDDPAPYVLYVSFGESYLLFEVRAWTSDFDNFLSVKTSLMVSITRALQEAGIQIPFPQRDVYIRPVKDPRDLRAPSQPTERAEPLEPIEPPEAAR